MKSKFGNKLSITASLLVIFLITVLSIILIYIIYLLSESLVITSITSYYEGVLEGYRYIITGEGFCRTINTYICMLHAERYNLSKIYILITKTDSGDTHASCFTIADGKLTIYDISCPDCIYKKILNILECKIHDKAIMCNILDKKFNKPIVLLLDYAIQKRNQKVQNNTKKGIITWYWSYPFGLFTIFSTEFIEE